jgi:hypothetical protein
MAQEDHWLPGFNFNVEEWDEKGLHYETPAGGVLFSLITPKHRISNQSAFPRRAYGA